MTASCERDLRWDIAFALRDSLMQMEFICGYTSHSTVLHQVILLLWVIQRTALTRFCHLVQAHSNASQYMPLLLIYIALLEAGGSTPTWLLHVYGELPHLDST